MVVAVGGGNSFGVFFEPLLLEFGWTRAITSGAFSAAAILSGLFGLGAGKLSDMFGPKLVVTTTGLFLCLGYLLMSQVNTVWQLYVFYSIFLAIGARGHFAPLLSTIARWFVKRRGAMTGIVMAGTGIGTVLMPLLGGWLIYNYGWRTSFIILGIVSLSLIITATQFLRRDPKNNGQILYGELDLEQKNLSLENRGLSLREAIHTGQFWLLFLILLSGGFCVFTILAHIVIHAIGLGIPATSAASILAFIGGLNSAGRLVMGGAADVIGGKRALIICLALMMASASWLLFATELWMLYIFGIVFGFAYGGVGVQTSPITAEFFGLSSHGVLYGFITMGFTVGGSIGPVLIGHIFDITGSYQLGFIVLAIVSFIGLAMTLLLKPIRPGKNEEPSYSV
jgi:MFS family permease